jgi:glycosyltransferase involved in cell wall biosynthesis
MKIMLDPPSNDIPLISVCVPAHNEEKFIGACLDSIKKAAEQIRPATVEMVVCINRCTDSTEDIARSHGAVIVKEDEKNIAKITNAAVRRARGEIIVTIDADSRMSPNMLSEVMRLLENGRLIGGGASIKLERMSLGIIVSAIIIVPILLVKYHRVSAGLFWLKKKDFDAIGGFDESLISVQDLDFARRLKTHGRNNDKQSMTIKTAHIKTSARKFDEFGDWHMLKNARSTLKLLNGRDRETADRYYYHPGR